MADSNLYHAPPKVWAPSNPSDGILPYPNKMRATAPSFNPSAKSFHPREESHVNQYGTEPRHSTSNALDADRHAQRPSTATQQQYDPPQYPSEPSCAQESEMDSYNRMHARRDGSVSNPHAIAPPHMRWRDRHAEVMHPQYRGPHVFSEGGLMTQPPPPPPPPPPRLDGATQNQHQQQPPHVVQNIAPLTNNQGQITHVPMMVTTATAPDGRQMGILQSPPGQPLVVMNNSGQPAPPPKDKKVRQQPKSLSAKRGRPILPEPGHASSNTPDVLQQLVGVRLQHNFGLYE